MTRCCCTGETQGNRQHHRNRHFKRSNMIGMRRMSILTIMFHLHTPRHPILACKTHLGWLCSLLAIRLTSACTMLIRPAPLCSQSINGLQSLQCKVLVFPATVANCIQEIDKADCVSLVRTSDRHFLAPSTSKRRLYLDTRAASPCRRLRTAVRPSAYRSQRFTVLQLA